ncbi:MAG: hypothetical protein ACK415_10020, partial [Thermodesulfovibrionales bacterium]
MNRKLLAAITLIPLLAGLLAPGIVFGGILPVAGQEEVIKRGEVLSLKRCIEIALKEQPKIGAAAGGKSAAESRVGQAKA